MPIEMLCEGCKQPFYCYQSEADKGRKYCSLTCRGKHAINQNAASRTPISFICKNCDKPFTMMLSYVTAYRKKFKREPLYCSMPCSDAGRKRDTEARNKFTCVNCGKESQRHRNHCGRVYTQQKLCSKQCKNEWVSKVYREKHGLPKITSRMRRKYVTLNIPAQNGQPARKDVLEHRYVMTQHIGRELLPEETVHHRNGDRTNNSLENLELFSGRHGPGQRVIDKVTFAAEILRLYPEFARQIGVRLCDCEHCPVAPTPP